MSSSSAARTGIDRAVARIEDAMSVLAGLALAAMLVLMGAEVVMRYLLERPLGWSVAFIEDYLMVGIFYLGLSATYRAGAHVAIDFVHERCGPRTRLAMDLTGQILSFGLFVLVFIAGWETTAQALELGEVPPPGGGPLSWPSWTSYALVPLGSAVLLVRLAATVLTHRSATPGAETEVRG